MSALGGAAARAARVIAGAADYEAYVAHMAATHPAVPPVSREEFCREREAARYGEGVRFRCC